MNAPITLTEAREKIGEAVNAAVYRRERVLLQRHGKTVAAIISIDDLDLLKKLEDQLLGNEALRRLRDLSDAVVPYEKVRKELGLDQPTRQTTRPKASRRKHPRKRVSH